MEGANVLRRAASAGEITVDTAALAHAELVSLRVELFSYEQFATRDGWVRNWGGRPTVGPLHESLAVPAEAAELW